MDPRFLYKSRSHAPIFEDLLAGIRRREGLIVLTGDIGMGKTTLCRAVLEELDRKTFCTFVPDPFVSREDLLKMLLVDFGVMSVDDLKSGRLNGVSRPHLSYPLYEFLNSLVPLQAFAVLIIDEAQNLSVPLLEEIRILSDLEAPEKLLQVVLVGQLEFQAKLKLPEMRQVDQRVSVRCNLEALNNDGVGGYIAHRLQVAGGSPDRVAFAPGAIDLIFQKTGGVPRLINLICDRSLHHGYLARVPIIESEIVRLAMIDLGLAASEHVVTIPAEIEEPAPQENAESKTEQPSEEIVFEEHDLVHADHATPLDPPPGESLKNEQAATAAVDRPLLFESPRTWTGASPSLTTHRRWRRRTRRLMLAAVAAAIVAFALYWQAQWDNDIQSEATPEAPDSHYEAFALTFRPKRVPKSVPLAPIVDQNAAALAPAATSAGPGIFAIDVALFSSSARASGLVEQLGAAGFRAYVKDLDLGDRGHLHEVVAGPFATRAETDAALARIRALPGFGDARAISSAP